MRRSGDRPVARSGGSLWMDEAMSNARRWVILCLVIMILVFLFQVFSYALALNPWHVPLREMRSEKDLADRYFFTVCPAFLSVPLFYISVLYQKTLEKVENYMDMTRDSMLSMRRFFRPPNMNISPSGFICLIATGFVAFSLLLLYMSLTGDLLGAE